MDVVGVLVERLRRLSKLAVRRQYGSPLNLRIRKATPPPKRLWSKNDMKPCQQLSIRPAPDNKPDRMNVNQIKNAMIVTTVRDTVESPLGEDPIPTTMEGGPEPRMVGLSRSCPYSLTKVAKPGPEQHNTAALAVRTLEGEGCVDYTLRNQLFQISTLSGWLRVEVKE